MKLPSLVVTVFMLVLISNAFVFPTNTFATNASADKATLEAIARGYLQGKAAAVGVGGKIPDILLSSVKEGPSFYVTRFVQTYNSLRVFNTSASVMISKSGLQAVDATTSFKSWDSVVGASIDSQAALEAATAAIAEKVTVRGSPRTEKVIYVREASTPRLSATGQSIVLHDAETTPQVAGICWEVNVPTLEPLGDWLVVVDGASGKAILKQDLIRHDSGSGWVYHYSNPVQTGGNLAWPAPDDLDHDILTQQETSMSLLHLASGTGKLVGDFVDLTAPGIIGGYKSAGLADNVTRYYHYTRSNDAFEEVMVYYYVDSVHSYLQQIGEIYLLNYSIPAHAHYYAVANAFWDFDGLHFGDGTLSYSIDTAEDADVIIHEYGHAIHGDEGLFNGWVSEEMGAFSEGFSDYLAASFLDQGATGTLGCLSEWFGYGLGYPGGTYPYCMRNTFSTKHYPEDKTGEVHDDGEMWSTALWQLRTSLGKGVVDRLAIEMGYYLWSSASFLDAVNAIIQVDRVIYAGAHESTIRQVFRGNGMLSYSVRTDAYPQAPFWSSPIDIPAENKGFERGSFGPEWGVDYNDPAYTPQVQSSIRYAGTYAAELVGSSSESSYSAIYYEFSMPSTATWVRLRFHYRIDTNDNVNYDWFEWRLGTPSWYWYDRWLADTGGGWNTYQTSIWVNALQGQTCRLTFLLNDDGNAADPTYVYIDGSGGSGYWDDIFLQWSDFHASITLNGVSHDTPPETEIRVLDGATVSLSAPSETKVGGLTYRFMQWWDRVNGQWFNGGVNTVHPSFTPTSDIYLEADYKAASWSGWQLLGSTPSAPTEVYDWYDGCPHVFVRGQDNSIYHRYFVPGVGGGWSSWEWISGTTTATPAATTDSNGNLHLIVRGPDGGFYWRMQAAAGGPHLGGWTSWQSVAGGSGTYPAVVSSVADRIDLAVRGPDGATYHAFWRSTSGWSSWYWLGGVTNDPIAITADASVNKLFVIVRAAADTAIYRRELDLTNPSQHTAWSPWIWTPITAQSTPAVIATAGRLDMFVRSTGNSIMYWSSASGSSQIPGATIDTPTAAYRQTGAGLMIELVVRGVDNAIYHKTFNTATGMWDDWTWIPGTTPTLPAISVNTYGDELYLSARGFDSGIYAGTILLWMAPPP